MVLYHILSKQRLIEKKEYAEQNFGRLLLTPHIKNMDMTNGHIPEYLHCLFNIVGAIPFSAKFESSIIKIKLCSKVKYQKYQGAQDLINFSKFDQDVDVIHTIYENKNFFQWQEVLLTNNSSVQSWTDDKIEIIEDFKEQLSALEQMKISSDDFFYRDFTLEEQSKIALLVGHHTGLQPLSKEKVADLKKIMNAAYSRIEKLYDLI